MNNLGYQILTFMATGMFFLGLGIWFLHFFPRMVGLNPVNFGKILGIFFCCLFMVIPNIVILFLSLDVVGMFGKMIAILNLLFVVFGIVKMSERWASWYQKMIGWQWILSLALVGLLAFS